MIFHPGLSIISFFSFRPVLKDLKNYETCIFSLWATPSIEFCPHCFRLFEDAFLIDHCISKFTPPRQQQLVSVLELLNDSFQES